MAAIDFPNSPTLNQLFAAPNGVTYQWNGSLWAVYGTLGLLAATAPPTYDSVGGLILDNSAAYSIPAAAAPLANNVGVQVFNRVFTANTPTNPIEVDVTSMFGGGNAGTGCLALFIDGVNVAQQGGTYNTSWGLPVRLYWQGVLAAGPHTFMLRFAGNTGLYLNGANANSYTGQRTTMKINEVGVGVQGPPGQAGPAGGWQPGDTVTTYRTTPSVGWIVMDDGTIGDASSGASTLADPSAQALFSALWPLAGCTIAGGKGANAAADWGAHKALSLPKVLSRLLAIGGAAGAGLGAHNPADTVGTSETPTTSGDNYSTGINPGPGGWAFSNQGHAHPQVMPPTTYLKMHIKL